MLLLLLSIGGRIMRKMIALLTVLCSLFTFAAADVDTQMAWAMETTDLLYRTAANETYMAAVMADKQMLELVNAWADGDPSAPHAVYRIVFDMDFLAEILFESTGGLDKDLPLRNERILMAIPNMMISSQRVISVAASSATRTSKAYVGECGCELWLIDYEQGGDVVVTFCPYDTGAVVVTASFLGSEVEAAKLAEQMIAFNGTGLMTVEKIR